jgi:hypothetical protein
MGEFEEYKNSSENKGQDVNFKDFFEKQKKRESNLEDGDQCDVENEEECIEFFDI